MGVGNTLLQDDGIGVHVTESLKTSQQSPPDVSFIDGGTIGLSLLPEIEDADGLDFIDPVPLVSPLKVPPPPELVDKHFNDWELAFIQNDKLT